MEEASFLVIGAPRIRVRRLYAFLALPRAKTPDQLGHSLTDQMVLQPPAFKAEARGGEV